MRKIRFLFIVVVIISCGIDNNKKLCIHPNQKEIELFQPYRLSPGLNWIDINDYHLGDYSLDSVVCEGQRLELHNDSVKLDVVPSRPLSSIHIYSNGACLELPILRSLKKESYVSI